jgi:hypothetical protein
MRADRSLLLCAAVTATATLVLTACTSGPDSTAPSPSAAVPTTSASTPSVSSVPTVSDTPTAPATSPAPSDTVPPTEGPAGPTWTARPTRTAEPTRTAGPTRTSKPPTVTGVDPALQSVQVVPASDRAHQAQLVKTLCATAVANVACVFTPSGPLVPVLGPAKLIAPAYQVCDSPGFETVEVSDTTESSTTLGVSVSVELGKIVKTGFEASFSTTWSQSFTTKVEDKMQLPAYSVGYVYRAPPMLRATGELFIREVGAILPGTGTAPQWYAYRLPSVVFDSPDSTASGHGSLAFVNRPMTASEKASCAAKGHAHPGGGR